MFLNTGFKIGSDSKISDSWLILLVKIKKESDTREYYRHNQTAVSVCPDSP